MSRQSRSQGKVYLVGAGPGDPGLITVRALEVLSQADCVVHDALIGPSVLAAIPPHAERIDAGKRHGEHKMDQEAIQELLAAKAAEGKMVVRLKGGDPFVFGRGSEEAIYLHGRGIEVESVPGVTAASATAACAGIPVTHRQIATTVTLITGHEDPAKEQTQTDYAALAALARSGGTLCFYMAMGRLGSILGRLIDHGLSTDTPAAAVRWGTLPKQRTIRATVGTLADAVASAELGAPAMVFVGPVVEIDSAGAMRWFENRPLFGQTILITRTREKASVLRRGLEALGARVIEAPSIAIEPVADTSAVDQALLALDRYAWLVLTSAHGVEALKHRLAQLNLDARALAPVRIAAIGSATATALAAMGIRADLIPEQYVAESLAESLLAQGDCVGRRVLMLRADIARADLREILSRAQVDVDDLTVYRTVPVAALTDEAAEALADRRVNWVAFTSSSTVRNFISLLPDRTAMDGVCVASIGPITSKTARESGLNVDVEASPHDVPGLIEALARTVDAKRA